MTNIPTKDEFLTRYVAEFTDGAFIFLYLRALPGTTCSVNDCGKAADIVEWDVEDPFENGSLRCLMHAFEYMSNLMSDVLVEHRAGEGFSPYLHTFTEDHVLKNMDDIVEGWLTLWQEGDAPLRNHDQQRSVGGGVQ